MKTPPGRCFRAALLAILFALIAWFIERDSDAKRPKHSTTKPPIEAQPQAQPRAQPQPQAQPKLKTKTYSFGGLDIEGRLKTPQLLYFLSRMKTEFDTTIPKHRSFIPELQRSAREL